MPSECKAVVLYWSKGGNTKKVAETIHRSLNNLGISSQLLEITPDLEVNYLDFHLVFIGAPVYSFLPPEPVTDFLKKRRSKGTKILPAAPELSGHFAVVFCTYGGGHTGIREALPLLKYVGQFFEHAGIRVVDEWDVVGEFPGADAGYNAAGRLGDITERPNENDLNDVAGKVIGLLRRLKHKLPLEGIDI